MNISQASAKKHSKHGPPHSQPPPNQPAMTRTCSSRPLLASSSSILRISLSCSNSPRPSALLARFRFCPFPAPSALSVLERSDTPLSHFLCSASRACDLAFATISSACLVMLAATLFALLMVSLAATQKNSISSWLDFCVASALSSA